jgi:hypothetical protein
MKSSLRTALGLALLVDGGAALFRPRKYLRGLKSGAPIIDDTLEFFAERPDLATKVAALEVVVGVCVLFA